MTFTLFALGEDKDLDIFSTYYLLEIRELGDVGTSSICEESLRGLLVCGRHIIRGSFV